MHEFDIERVARATIAERITPPRAVPRQRRRTTIADKLRRTDSKPSN